MNLIHLLLETQIKNMTGVQEASKSVSEGIKDLLKYDNNIIIILKMVDWLIIMVAEPNI